MPPWSGSLLQLAPRILGALRVGLIVVALAGVWRVPLRDPWRNAIPTAAVCSLLLTVGLALAMRRGSVQRGHAVVTAASIGAAVLDWLWVGLVALPDLGLGPATGALVVLVVALHGMVLAPGWSLLTDMAGIGAYAVLGAGGWLLVSHDTLAWQVLIYVLLALVIARIARHLRLQSERIDHLSAQFALYQSAQSALLHALPVGVVVLDGALTPRYANDVAFALLGVERPLSAERFVPTLDAQHEALAAQLRRLVRAVLEDGVPRRERFLVRDLPVAVGNARAADRSGDGDVSLRPIRVDGTRLPGADGRPVVGVVIADARDEALLNHFVRQAERGAVVSELAGALAHELRNPLMTITMAAEVLPRVTGEQRDDAVALIQGEGARVRRLLDEFLQFSRVPSQVQYSGVDLPALLARLVAGQRILALPRHVTVELVADAVLPAIDADPELLTRALTNVLGNAQRYVPEYGRIQVRVSRTVPADWQDSKSSGVGSGGLRPSERYLTITVTDTGPGIPPHVLALVGQPFVRTAEGGTGLGLAIVSRVVALHGGALRIANTAEGGAEVRLILPQHAPALVGV